MRNDSDGPWWMFVVLGDGRRRQELLPEDWKGETGNLLRATHRASERPAVVTWWPGCRAWNWHSYGKSQQVPFPHNQRMLGSRPSPAGRSHLWEACGHMFAKGYGEGEGQLLFIFCLEPPRP